MAKNGFLFDAIYVRFCGFQVIYWHNLRIAISAGPMDAISSKMTNKLAKKRSESGIIYIKKEAIFFVAESVSAFQRFIAVF